MAEPSFLFLQKKELLLEEAKPSEMDLKKYSYQWREIVYLDSHLFCIFLYNSRVNKRQENYWNIYSLPSKLFKFLSLDG